MEILAWERLAIAIYPKTVIIRSLKIPQRRTQNEYRQPSDAYECRVRVFFQNSF